MSPEICLGILGWAVGLTVLVPVVVYLSVRMGTFGYLRARQQFEKYLEEEDHGA